MTATIYDRYYQKVAVWAIIAQFKNNKHGRCTLVRMPVRSGKTKIGLDFADVWCGNGRCLVVTPRIDIVRQWQRTADTDYPGRWQTGIIGDGNRQLDGTLTCSTIASATQHIDEILSGGDYNLLICDEAHRYLSVSGKNIVDTFLARTKKNGGVVVFMTATPDRSDNQVLSRYISNIAIDLDHNMLARYGVLVEPNTVFVDDNELETMFNAWESHASERQTIVFVPTKLQAERWAEYWRDNGYRAVFVTSDTPSGDRQRLIQGYRDNYIQVIVNVNILTEGIDINNTGCVVLAVRPKSDTPENQRIGRALGGADFKKDAIIIMHSDDRRAAVTKPSFTRDRDAERRNGLSPFSRRVYDWLGKVMEFNEYVHKRR